MLSDHASAEMLGALSRLLSLYGESSLPLEITGVEAVRECRAEVTDQLSNYVIPRLVQLDAPMLTVVGGSTGAGKSTLVNSIVGETVTEAGVLRPTTRSPVLVHHPEDREWFLADRILPDLPRTTEIGNTTYSLRLASSDRVPKGLAILDAPDIDSIDAVNRELAAQLLAAADLWLFVTSAARYADQVPWDYLAQASQRSTSVAVVLDRTAPEAVHEVRGHLARMMTSRGLSDSPLFTVPEIEPDEDGLLPRSAVEPIVGWLYDLAADDEARSSVVRATLDGAVRHIVLRTHDIADAMDQQIATAEALYNDIDRCYREAAETVISESGDGTLLRGEVLARWQEFVGTGDLMRSLEDRVGRIRDRVREGVAGKRNRSQEVREAVESGLQTLLIERAEAAAETAWRAWGASQAGRTLLESQRGLDRASREARVRAERLVRDWQADVLELVRVEGSDKRMTARFLAFGVSGLGVALMITTFVHQAAHGATEVAGGAAEAGRRLLEAVFGEQAAHRLVERARGDLNERVTALFEEERARYLDLLDSPEVLRANQEKLRGAARQSEYARHTDFLDSENRERSS